MLQSLHWLPIEYRIQHKIATLTFKARFHHQPNYVYQLITTYTPSHLLRSSDARLLAVPRTSTTTAARAFRVTAPRIWNSLPETIRSATSVSQFTRHLKSHLFSVAFSWLRDSSRRLRLAAFMTPLYKSLIHWLTDWPIASDSDLLLQTECRGQSVCIYVCLSVSHVREPWKQLNASRCHLGADSGGPKEPCAREGCRSRNGIRGRGNFGGCLPH